MTISFSGFTLDPAARELRREGQLIRTSPKAFDLLLLLVTERPRVVPKSEILDKVWNGVFIADTTLAGVIAELRNALGDDAREPRFIRTAHRVGYAFCGDVQTPPSPSAPAGSYRLIMDGQQLQLRAGDNVIGRERSAAIWVDHPSISRRHAVIVVAASDVTVEDLGSKNGTFVRGNRIESAVRVADGDDIRFGNVPAIFRVFVEGVETETAGS